IYGTVLNQDDSSTLPGVTVKLTGAATQIQVTDGQGKFRFQSLPPGSYNLRVEIEGFTPLEQRGVSVNIARNTSVEIRLKPAVIQGETINVVADRSPLLDPLRQGPGQVITLSDLEKTPTARDPWAVMASTPGVLPDRINVGGNESGQQSLSVGPGSLCDQAVWSMDGMVITDMSALGSSPTYYDFDAFEEMQVSTGGTDASLATGGVVLNMVTKRGTNDWRG